MGDESNCFDEEFKVPTISDEEIRKHIKITTYNGPDCELQHDLEPYYKYEEEKKFSVK